MPFVKRNDFVNNARLGGTSSGTHSHFERLENRQLMSSGVLDPKFGTGGVVPIGFTGFDVAVDSAGRTIVAGQMGADFAVLRLNPNGSPDASFGTNGLVTTDLGGKAFDRGQSVAVQSDGKIILAGLAVNTGGISTPASGRFALVRYNVNGSLDSSFGDGGEETVLGSLTTHGVGAIAIQPDGKIVYAGDYKHGGDFDFITFRLQSNGLLDGSFGDARGSGSAGYVVTGMGGDDEASALLIQPDGKIVVAGTRFIFDDEFNLDQFALARYTPAGKLDKNGFGDGGKVITRMAGDSTLYSIAQQDDGKIVAAGSMRGQDRRTHILVRRFTTGGDDDTTLNGGSIFMDASSNSISTVATNVFIRAGKIFIVGMDQTAGQPYAGTFAAQYTVGGTLDSTFGPLGSGGVAHFDIAGGSLWARAAVAPNGRMVFAYQGGSNLGGVARFVQALPQAYIGYDKYFATEGFDNGSIKVGRDAAYDFPTRVYINLRGTATYGKDYTSSLTTPAVPVDTLGNPIDLHGIVLDSPVQGYIDIPAGKSEVTVPINLTLDNKLEPLKQATFILFDNPAYSRKQTMQDAYVRILDDDTASIDFEAKTGGTLKPGDRADFGQKFGNRNNGLSYGWDVDNTGNARNRGNKRSPDSRYDSFNHMQRSGADRKWEMAVPNGLYQVIVVAGDPNATDSVYRINVEGKLALSGTPSGDVHWFSRLTMVMVEDGRLTVTNGAGAVNNKIAYIEIRSPATPGAEAGMASTDFPIRLKAAPAKTPVKKGFVGFARSFFSDQPIDGAAA